MKQKLQLVTIGYGFLALNYYALTVHQPLFGIGFSVTAAVFFIRAIRVKK